MERAQRHSRGGRDPEAEAEDREARRKRHKGTEMRKDGGPQRHRERSRAGR